MLTVPNSDAKTLNILKFPRHAQGIGRISTVSQVCVQTLDSS